MMWTFAHRCRLLRKDYWSKLKVEQRLVAMFSAAYSALFANLPVTALL